MAKTKVIYKDTAPDARQNVTPRMANTQPFCGLDDLKLEHIKTPSAATLELDYWRLDGTFSTFPDDPTGRTWGVWSQDMAGADGVFAKPPVLTLEFTALFTSVGLSFSFHPHGPDWCSDLNIKWYKDAAMLADEDFHPDAWSYPCVREVRNYNRIVVTFRAMSKPYRYLKLQSAIYGIVRTFSPEEFRSINLFQAASPISADLEINTLDLTLSSRDPVPFLFQRKQPMEVYHDDRLQGVFYIGKSQRVAESVYEIEGSDLLGLMDESGHRGGVYENILFTDLVSQIMGAYPFELEVGLGSAVCSGWLPAATRRENLAQACFSVGAVADTSGSSRVRIFPVRTAVSASFGADRMYYGSQTETAALVTAVEVSEHKYTLGDKTQELFSDDLQGTAEIVFSAPMHSLQISGGTITESGANYAIISGRGAVTLTGKEYAHTTRIVRVSNPDVGAGDIANVIEVPDATLVGAANALAVARRVYAHYQRRESIKATLVLANERPGDMVEIVTPFDGIKMGVIKSLDIDLARKRIGEAVIVCE